MHSLVQHYRVIETVPETKYKFPAGLPTCCVTLETTLNLSEPWFPLSVDYPCNKHLQRLHFAPGARLGIEESVSSSWFISPKPALEACQELHISPMCWNHYPGHLTGLGVLRILKHSVHSQNPLPAGPMTRTRSSLPLHHSTVPSAGTGPMQTQETGCLSLCHHACHGPTPSSCLCACCRCSFPGKCSS